MAKSVHGNLIGRMIAGKFLVESAIGSGAMGAVFRARQVALDKTVAIKVLHGENADDPTFAARFQREAKAASRLNHPNSMQVIDFGAEPDGLLYIAMEYLDGRSLHRVLSEDGALPVARIADILMQTLAALAVAHDMGVVHRDLKPENIVILKGTDDDGRARDVVKVCDFGIAKINDSRAYRGAQERESNAPVTTAGFLVGTPEYMSPEQARGDKLDARSDLYSVGVVLYEMLTGRVPFVAESALGVVLRHLTEAPRLPSGQVSGVDPRLEAICMKALRKPPDARYGSAREMRAELRAVVEPAQAAASSAPDLSSAPGQSGAGGLFSALNVQPRSSEPATGHATPVSVDTRGVSYEPPKPTLAGTSSSPRGRSPRTAGRDSPTGWHEANVRRRPGRLTKVALVATATGVLVAALAAVLLARSDRQSAGRAQAHLDLSEAASAPPTTIETLPIDEEVPPFEATSVVVSVRAPTPSRIGAASTAKSSASGSGVASSAAAVVPAATAVAVSATASVAPLATSLVAGALQAPAAPLDPSFEPSHAYVEIGLINAQGVRERAVRGALHGAGFAGCYRAALKAQGARVTGVGTLNLSIDQNGVGRAAIVTGTGFLPGLTRCLQGAAAVVSVAKSQVDSGGGTAEVTLAFKAP